MVPFLNIRPTRIYSYNRFPIIFPGKHIFTWLPGPPAQFFSLLFFLANDFRGSQNNFSLWFEGIPMSVYYLYIHRYRNKKDSYSDIRRERGFRLRYSTSVSKIHCLHPFYSTCKSEFHAHIGVDCRMQVTCFEYREHLINK